MGNFGSLDQGPAAQRYTESKISDFGYTLVEGLKKKITPMTLNYDGTIEEPVFLPVPFPYLLVNGTSGIGVGMAASIPSHPLKNVLDAVSYLVKNPMATNKELVEKLVGPDFSTGCDIVNKDDFESIYETGRGSFKMRAKFAVTGSQIKITNLPYKVSGSKVMTQLLEAQEKKELTFVKDVVDLSSGTETLIVEVSTKDMDMAIRELCRVSDLEKSFPMDFSVVFDKPGKTNLKDYLTYWVAIHKQIEMKDLIQQKEAVVAREHIVDGLLKAILQMDEIIKLIRASENRAAAKTSLEKIGFSSIQADAILDMKLSRLTKLSGAELEQEKAELSLEKKRLTTLIENEESFNSYLVEKFNTFQTLSSKRQSTISNNVFPKKVKEEITEFSVVVKGNKALIAEGFSRASNAYNGDKENAVYLLSENTVVPVKNTKDPVVTNVWGVLTPSTNAVYHISEDGYIKKTDASQLKTSRKAIVAKQDKVAGVLFEEDSKKYVLITLSDGKKVQFLTDDINATGRNARGVGAVKLENSQTVISAEWSEKIPGVQVGRNKKVK